MAKRVDMSDVAAKAGVHQTTVSLALRGHPRIPESTRTRIRAIAQELGYRPNPFVAAFVASRHRGYQSRRAVLGYITGDEDDEGGRAVMASYRDFYEGTKARAQELGFGIEHFWLGDPKLTRSRFNQITETRAIHGLIVGPLKTMRRTLDIDWARFAAVAYGYSMLEPRVHRVSPNFYQSMIDTLRHCRAAGYRRVGLMLDENADHKNDHLWLSAFLSSQHRSPADERVPPLLQPAWELRSFKAWLKRCRVEVVICLNTLIQKLRQTPEGQAVLATPKLQFVLLNASATQTYSAYAGVLVNRGDVGAACVDQLVGMLYRNEKGIPSRVHDLMVQTGWHDGVKFGPAAPGPAR
jgi:LacI family transcriptional regulator